MNVYTVIGIWGVISGILCAQADVPLAWSGRRGDPVDAKAVGRITSWWTEVSEKRFDLAFCLSCIGQPGTYLTMWMLSELISSPVLSLCLKINTFISAYTGLLFHAAACIKPMVYRKIAGQVSDETAQEVMNAIDRYPAVPSIVSAICLLLGTTVIMVTAILTGALAVSKVFVLFNPVGALLFQWIQRRLNLKIGGAMGIGFSLYAIILIAAGMGMH